MDRVIKNVIYMGCAGLLWVSVLSTPASAQNAEIFFVETDVDPAGFGGGPTVVDISQRLGDEIMFDIYVRALGTLTPVRAIAMDFPCVGQGGAGGSVTYVLGTGRIFVFRTDFVFGTLTITQAVDQSKCPAANVRFAVALNEGDLDISGMGAKYIGEFSVAVSADAAGSHTFPLIGGSDIVDVDSGPIPVFLRDLVLRADGDPPTIKHGDFETTRTQPCTGFIDPRFDSNNGVDANLGLVNRSNQPDVVELTIEFSEAVFSMGGGEVGPGDFEVTETGSANPPTVINVEDVLGDDTVFTLGLSRSITVQEWTTIRALVQNVGGLAIENNGNMGPGVAEPDRVDIGFLPGDINQGGSTSPFDLIRAKQKILGTCGNNCPECSGIPAGYDVNRNGNFSTIDLVFLKQIFLNSGNTTQSWNGKFMNNTQP